MRISDWSSDVCSSDLNQGGFGKHILQIVRQRIGIIAEQDGTNAAHTAGNQDGAQGTFAYCKPDIRIGAAGTVSDRQSVVMGKSVSVRVDLGGRRSIKKQKKHDSCSRMQKKKPT